MYSLLTFFVQILQLIILIFIVIYFIKKRQTSTDEFVTANSILHNVVDIYYDSILKSKIEKLKKNYDLNPESKTNSISVYTVKYNELIVESAKQIIKEFISKNCRYILLQYYDMNSIILTIISYLNLKR